MTMPWLMPSRTVRRSRQNARRRGFALALERLDERVLLAVPAVQIDALTATNAATLAVTYDVNASSVPSIVVSIYRSPANTLNTSIDPFIESETLTGTDLTPGHHSQVPITVAGGLQPDPAHPFVFAVAAGPDGMQTSASFQKVVIGVVTHGFDTPLATDPPAWVNQMANTLQFADHYNRVIAFGWVPESFLPISGEAVAAGQRVAAQVEALLQDPTVVPPGAVVDLHFIGHSRGTVVVNTAFQTLTNDLSQFPQIQGGYWRETLLDPHPAHDFTLERFGHSLNPISLSAWITAKGLSFGMADPYPLFVSPRVTDIQDYYERTSVDVLSSSSPILFTTEQFLNPWGAIPNQGVFTTSPSTLFQSQPLTAPGIGHSEVHEWYYANVVPTLGTVAPFVTGPIDAPLSGYGYNLTATVGTMMPNSDIAAFNDPDPSGVPSDYAITIDWGEHTTSPGTAVSSILGGFYITGSHTYQSPGVFVTTVQINDIAPNGGGSKLTVQGSVNASFGSLEVVGSPAGALPFVTVIDTSTGAVKAHFLAYPSTFKGGVQAALADVNGDGFPDIITAPGPGGGALVEVFSGKDGSLLRAFTAFSGLKAGLNVAGGDIDGDGHGDIVVAPGPGGPPVVKVFSGATGGLLAQVNAGPTGAKGGVSLTAHDVNGDGLADVQASLVVHGKPRTVNFDGRALTRQEAQRLRSQNHPLAVLRAVRRLLFGNRGLPHPESRAV